MHGVELIGWHIRAANGGPHKAGAVSPGDGAPFFIFPRQKLQFYTENGRLDFIEP
jgi:hypothetical protein